MKITACDGEVYNFQVSVDATPKEVKLYAKTMRAWINKNLKSNISRRISAPM